MKVRYKVGLSEKWLPKATVYLPPLPLEHDPEVRAAANTLSGALQAGLREALGEAPSLEGLAIMRVVGEFMTGFALQMAEVYMRKPWRKS